MDDGEVAQQISFDYNALPPIWYRKDITSHRFLV